MIPKIGDSAPDFELQNQKRQPVRLSSFRGSRNVVIMFHPLAFTPVCSTQMSGLEQNSSRLADLDAHTLGISIDSTASKAAWAKAIGVESFDLLSDFFPHGAVAESYGVLRPEGFSERATFIVDKAGKVAFARRYDVPEQPDLGEVFAALERLKA